MIPCHARERMVMGVALIGLNGMDTLSSPRIALAEAGSLRFRFPVSPHLSRVNLALPTSSFVFGLQTASLVSGTLGSRFSPSSRSFSRTGDFGRLSIAFSLALGGTPACIARTGC